MSVPSIVGNPQDVNQEHIAIIRHVRFNETLHGGWDEWSVACICGGLYEPKYKGYYIPSQQQAERIFNAHAGIREIQGNEESLDFDPGTYIEYYRTDTTLYDERSHA